MRVAAVSGWCLAAMVAVAGCEKSRSTTTAPSGSATAEAEEPNPCPPDIGERVDRAMNATEVYFTQVAAVVRPWSEATTCEAIRTGLEGLAEAGGTFQQAIEDAKLWAKNLSEACRDRLDELYLPRGKQLEATFRTIIDAGVTNVKRCGDHPGVREAAGRGLKLMRKK